MTTVSTLVVEWIEISDTPHPPGASSTVSTLVVEWIEIVYARLSWQTQFVSTLVVEWIEIIQHCGNGHSIPRLHPRGGVD